MRPRPVLASRPIVLRGEDFGFNAWSAAEHDRDTGLSGWSSLSDFIQRSRHHWLRSRASQALAEVPTIILCEARGLWLFGVIRGGIGLTRRLGAAEQHTGRLMSEWILSLEPEHRQNRWVNTKACDLGDQHLSSAQRSSCLRLQLFCVETFLLLPQCQSNGCDLSC